MDPLTDVFMSMRVESVVYGRLEATSPWGLSFDPQAHATFGMVVQGDCWLTVDDPHVEPVRLSGGDCYLLPRRGRHRLQDDLLTTTREISELLQHKRDGVMRYGGGGTPTTILGGKFTFDGASSRPLTELLPPVMRFRAGDSRTIALQATLQTLVNEISSPGPGSQVIVGRLADILFVQAIRAYVLSTECRKTGWLRALSDPSIGMVLTSMHGRIDHPWSVAELATAAGMSRSAFALRFKELVGEPPLEYLTRWRMYQAGRLLRDRRSKLYLVAKQVGYDSDGAFSKAFKRVLGVTPGEYRANGEPRSAEVPAAMGHRHTAHQD